MDVTQAIFVQGCARSGNTLMRELCVAGFRDAELVKVSNEMAECSLVHLTALLTARRQKHQSFFQRVGLLFNAQSKRLPLLVASRDRATSLAMDGIWLRASPAIKVIWMLRNPLDILTSVHPDSPGEFYVKPERLLASLELYDRFRNEEQVLTVHYEQLVSDANAVQTEIAKAFQIEPTRDFTGAHEHFPAFHQNIHAMHSIRPIDTKSVEKWKSNPTYHEYLQKVFAEHPRLVSLARACGYEINEKDIQ